MWHPSVLLIANSQVFLLPPGAVQLGVSVVLCGLHLVLNSEPRIRKLLATTRMQSENCQAVVIQASILLQSENLMFLESLLQRNSLWLSYEWWVLKNNVCVTYFCDYFRKCIIRGKQPAARIMLKTKLKVKLVQHKLSFCLFL